MSHLDQPGSTSSMAAGRASYLDALTELTEDQKIALVSGRDFWTTVALPEAGIPPLKLTDGPIGARGDLATYAPSACFPSGSAIGASWDTGLVGEIAEALAQETKLKGAHVLLGPTINLQRTPIGGRNFECLAEDPHLTGELAVSYVKALQACGVGACPKHYVGNDTEYQRFTISSDIDEATLNEVYLYPFERVVREASPWMIMAAYNAINGVQACSHRALNVSLLKEDWGFDGVLVSDWFAARDTVGNACGGLDLEMPGPSRIWGDALKSALAAGTVGAEDLEDKVARLLRLMDRAQPGPALSPEASADNPAHRALIRRAASAGMVVLKNETKILPLTPAEGASIAVMGPNAEVGQIMGGGSAYVNSHTPVHPLEGIRAAFPHAQVRHAHGCTNYKYLPPFKAGTLRTDAGEEGLVEERFESADFTGSPFRTSTIGLGRALLADAHLDGHGPQTRAVRLTGYYTPRHSGPRELGLFSAGPARLLVDDQLVVDNWSDWQPGGSFFGFGSDEVRAGYRFDAGTTYKIVVEYTRSPAALIAGAFFGINTPLEEDSIGHAARLAAACTHGILVLGSNSDWESEGHDRADMDLPGAQDALAEAVLAANPETIIVLNVGAPVAMPWYDKAKTVLVTWFPGEEMGNALGDVLSGLAEPSGRLPFTWPKQLADYPAFAFYPGTDGHMAYGEGRLIGHRWYDKKSIAPLAAFGHGLGYGDVTIEAVEAVSRPDNDQAARVTVSLHNRADRATRTTVQIYAEAVSGGEAEDAPLRKLVGFQKCDIGAGARAEAVVSIAPTALAEWDPVRKTRLIRSDVRFVAGLSSSALFKSEA